MNSRRVSSYIPLLFSVLLPLNVWASTIDFGSADAYAVLGEAGVTNTGPSMIFGNVGGSIGTPAITGFPPGTVVTPSALLTGNATVFNDATLAYILAQDLAGATNLTGSTLGVGLANNLLAGVYRFNSSAALDGTLVLDAGGSNTASWLFQIGSSLTTASASMVQIIDAGSTGTFTGSITWVVGSAATLGTTTMFQGTIISQAGTVLNTGATIGCGRAISLGGSVTLDDNTINVGNCAAVAGAGTGTGTGSGPGTGGTGGPVIPEPSTLALLGSGLFAMVLLAFRKTRIA